MTGWTGKIAEGALNLVLPPRCPSCGVIISAAGTICAPCWQALNFLSGPLCACCGQPFPYDIGADTICAACTADPPAFDSARAPLAYDEASAPLILNLKYADRPHLARTLARLAERAVPGPARNATLVPVPLHRARLRQRLYNQAALIAQALARRTGQPLVVDLLERRRATPPSTGLSRSARLRNVRGAIAVANAHTITVRDHRFLVVDDVYTTGATAEACARALKREGAARVDIVTITRAIRDMNAS